MNHPPDRLLRLRAAGLDPAHVPVPGPGQESVWDYPRPPALAPEQRQVRVEFGGKTVATSSRALRLCETASPPTFYFPPEDVDMNLLEPVSRRSLCEWKGQARYFDVVADGLRARNAAWCYPDARTPFEALAGWLAFMPAVMSACYVGEHRVQPQPGGFYGGWITPELVGPFKGEPGTLHW
jgi:uncharacterized protein (DUF427 family)